jgi:hypothetical protein
VALPGGDGRLLFIAEFAVSSIFIVTIVFVFPPRLILFGGL